MMTFNFEELEKQNIQIQKEMDELQDTKSRVLSNIEERHKILDEALKILDQAPTYTFEELEEEEEEIRRRRIREAEEERCKKEIMEMQADIDRMLADL